MTMAASTFDFNLVLDTYTRKARFLPALVLTVPVALAVLAWFPTDLKGLNLLATGVVWYVGASLSTELARDRGKALEPKLFKKWGGKPTTRMLRHRHAPNKALLERQHRALEALMKNISLPTAAEEKANPAGADDIYDACTAFLITRTRDVKQHALIFAENCNYGFRRNVLGLKPIGLVLSLVGAVAAGCKIVLDARSGTVSPLPVASTLFCLLLFAGWVFWFRPDWVKICANAYALQLLRACEVLGQAPAAS
jgi:hypothetical protein